MYSTTARNCFVSNLTQNHTENDPIDHSIKAFIFVFSKTDIQSSCTEISLIFLRDPNYKHLLDAEMGLEEGNQEIQELSSPKDSIN